MAVFAPIPLPKPGEGLAEGSDWMQKLLMAPVERRQKEAQAQHEKALAELESSPLKYDLLRAQIEATQALGAQRNAKTAGGGDLATPTKAFVTQNQKMIQSIDNVLPQIDSIIASGFPGQTVGKYIHPSQQAAYRAKAATLTDSLIGALGLPKTDSSLHLVEEMVKQKPFENREAYIQRLNHLKEDLKQRRGRSASVLQGGGALGGQSAAEEFGGDNSGASGETNDPLGIL